MDKKGVAPTGENFRKEMLSLGTFDLPLTGPVTISDSHTVSKPVYLVEVKDGKWGPKDVVK
jgi:branched-chain amino acid transport system substrate-binding protein